MIKIYALIVALSAPFTVQAVESDPQTIASKCIDLSHLSLKDALVKLKAVPDKENVTKIFMNKMQMWKSEDGDVKKLLREMTAALAEMPNIQEWGMKDNKLFSEENEEAVDEVKALISAAEKMPLKIWDISGNGINNEAIKWIKEIILNMADRNLAAPTGPGQSDIALGTKLKVLLLNGGSIHGSGVQDLSCIVEKNPCLEKLDISGHELGGTFEGGEVGGKPNALAVPLIQKSANLEHLKVLNMDCVDLRDETVTVLATALQEKFPALQELSIGYNDIFWFCGEPQTEDSDPRITVAKQLVNALKEKESLQKVHVVEDFNTNKAETAEEGIQNLLKIFDNIPDPTTSNPDCTFQERCQLILQGILAEFPNRLHLNPKD